MLAAFNRGDTVCKLTGIRSFEQAWPSYSKAVNSETFVQPSVSPYSINTMSSGHAMRIKKMIN